MATLYKRTGSPFWYTAYFRADGRRAYKSTGTRNKRKALEAAVASEQAEARARKNSAGIQASMADIINRAGREAAEGKLTLDRARKALMDLYRNASGECFPSYTVKEWLVHWIETKVATVGDSSIYRYRNSMKEVLSALGKKASKDLSLLTTEDVREVQTKLAKKIGAKSSTTNLKVQDFKSAIRGAHEQGILERNVGAPVRSLTTEDSDIRAQFEALEIETLMANAKPDWKGTILIGAHTGLRMSNIAELDWRDVNIERGEFTLKPVKQREVITIPMSASVLAYFESRNDRKTTGPVFETLSGITKATRSTAFNNLMKKAQLPKEIDLPGGNTGRRSFHSLRHYYVSALANSEVPEDVRKSLSGHKSGEVHEIYAHFDGATMRAAINTLPALTLI